MGTRDLCDGLGRVQSASCGRAEDYLATTTYGELLPGSSEQVGLWWASSGWKIGRERGLPKAKGEAILIRAAKNEAEAAQLVVRPAAALKGLTVGGGRLDRAGGATIPAQAIDILEVRYVNVTRPTDKSTTAGHWPDPLPPLTKPINLLAGMNQPFWIRVNVPRDARAGMYQGTINLKADGFKALVHLKVEVYDFELPDRMTCTTAFGFSSGNVFRYQGIDDPRRKHEVLEKYWANYSAHHISPVRSRAARSDRGDVARHQAAQVQVAAAAQPVTNEKHSGDRSLLIFDDRKDQNVEAVYEPLVPIPEGGLRLRFWYRTAVPGQTFLVTLNHYDAAGQWISGGNNDIGLQGNGSWQEFDRVIRKFPNGAKSVQLHLRAANWTESGEATGLAWFDDVSLTNAATGEEFIEGGAFEPPQLPQVEREKLQAKLDFTAWDKAMAHAIEHVPLQFVPSGHSRHGRRDLPFAAGAGVAGLQRGHAALQGPFQQLLLRRCRSTCGQKGWLDEAFVYWFDEPDPKDYPFVSNGFAKLKAAAPDLNRMLTEQVEPGLIGGPNIWCPISNNYKPETAEPRRQLGEKFWWYVCTGPKAPYCTLFIDHPATELRVWLWQTWQRKIEGMLVWETNYWTSPAAYPDRGHPQNPYEDPMGWQSGYSTPDGQKRPWGNGDGRFVYPPLAAADAHPDQPIVEGPVDSIRWEMLRDGIEDYEYLAILKRSDPGGRGGPGPHRRSFACGSPTPCPP